MAAVPLTLAGFSSQLHDVSKELKTQKRLLKQQGRKVVHGVRCYATVKVACVILALMAPQADVALEYIKFKRRNKDDAEEWTAETLLHHFHEFTTAEKESMLDPMHRDWGKYYQQASLWMRERGLRDWVSKQNVDKGVAPANEHVWQQHMASVAQHDTGALRPDSGARWKRRQRNQWIQRWAKRCQVHKGAFKQGERLSVETQRAKATFGSSNATLNPMPCEKPNPNWGPENGHEMWTTTHVQDSSADHFPAPILVLFFACEDWSGACLLLQSRGICNLEMEQLLGVGAHRGQDSGTHQHG